MNHYIKKYPNPTTLLSRVYGDTCPAGYEEATEEEAKAWVSAQIANGWQPQSAMEIVYASPQDIADYRWKIETGGVNVTVSTGTHKFDSSRENRVMWVALASLAQTNPSLTQGWKTLDHGFVVLTASDILEIYTKIFNHIALCFAKEAELLVNPCELKDLQSQNWPS